MLEQPRRPERAIVDAERKEARVRAECPLTISTCGFWRNLAGANASPDMWLWSTCLIQQGGSTPWSRPSYTWKPFVLVSPTMSRSRLTCGGGAKVPAGISLVARDDFAAPQSWGQHLKGDFSFRPVYRSQLDRLRKRVPPG